MGEIKISIQDSAVTIRKAEPEDCIRLMDLIRDLAVYEQAPDEVTVDMEVFFDAGFGNDPVWWAFVAEVQGCICGFALYYIRYSTWKGRRMYLEDIYIEPEYRNIGIGEMLLDCLVIEARRKQLNGIAWQVLQWNESAIEFYRKRGASFDGEWLNCSLDV